MLEVRLIGTFDVKCDGEPVSISSRIAQSLFAYLILNAGTSHRREKLAGMFWPDAPEAKARAHLRHELWLIRKALSTHSKSDYLIADNINISFNASAECWLDAAALKELSETTSIEQLMKGLSLFQGELLPGFYEDWLTQEREYLQSIFEQGITRLLETLESEARWQDILEWAERWISFGQRPEAAYRYLMIAYDALGDRAKVASIYQRCVQALCELDLEPSEQTRALAFKRTSKLNIPIPLTSFIGREKELKEIATLFSKSRLITLTGSGGVGKTRLSIQVIAEVLELFPDGVWFLDLAPLSDPALVPHTLVNLLGLRQSGEIPLTEMLINYFHTRTALLIFDNCEHLIESCAQLVNLLLISCADLSILATSREALRVSGEIHYRVPSLVVPKPDIEFAIDEFSNMESAKLFAERAAVASPGFAISPHNAPAVAQICQRLDGIPLAIELAAARVNILTVEQILKRLDDRFNLLKSGLRTALPRHQTLRATIEWSYDLLSEKERILFRRLAVFMGGWTLEAAEEVCSGNGIESRDVLDLLSQLVNKSLATVETSNNEARYRWLETIHQFAREKLFETGEATRLQDRHLKYFLKLAETTEPYLRRMEQIKWLKRLDAEHENFRSALSGALDKPSAGLVLRLAGGLGTFWRMRGFWQEGAKWLDQVLGRSWNENSKAEKAARAKAFYRRSDIANDMDELDVMKTAAESAMALCEEVEDAWGIAYSRILIANHQRRFLMFKATSRISLEQGVNEFRRLGDVWGESLALSWLAMVLLETGTREEFFETTQRAIVCARASGDRNQTAYLLTGHAFGSLDYSQWDEAERILEEAEQLYAEIDSSDGIIVARSLRILIFFARGNFEKAKTEAKLVIEDWDRFHERNQQAKAITVLALIAEAENDLQSAVAYAQKALGLKKEMRVAEDIAFGLILLGLIKCRQGNAEFAMQYVRDSLEFVRSAERAERMVLTILDYLAGFLLEKKMQAAVQILALTESLARSTAVRRDPVFDKPYFDRFMSEARAKLSEAEFTSAWEAGSKMSLDDAVAHALRELQ